MYTICVYNYIIKNNMYIMLIHICNIDIYIYKLFVYVCIDLKKMFFSVILMYLLFIHLCIYDYLCFFL